ncbi:MAG: Hsp70 family protein [Planctomycetaceae bacterium]|nr:Hsp70 family protein [Planctomycetaceae bacterium]
MKKTQAVGIDLGTTYSCIAYLSEHGQPVTIPNQEGELATPSVVFFDQDHPVVGTEALRNSIAHPDRVVQHAKRFMGDSSKYWKIGNARYTPAHISGMILRKLISAAQEQIGEIQEAVITVPAQFSDAQRHATVQAGYAAGLEKVEMINEPVAAALCHVLGHEGLHFAELAVDQQLLVYDLGGGTLDLAVVKYTTDSVRVVAADGDLQLGGLDWTQVLVDMAAEKFIADFADDPRTDKESLQFLSLEAEQAKRSLSVRPRAAVTVQHGRNRRTYQIELTEFEYGCQKLLERSELVTRRILKNNKMGWAHIDVVLTTGGSSRMPMIRNSLKKLSGRTLNSTLSPDQSIAHGAALYAGMLLANSQYARTVFNTETSQRLARVKQQSVCARHLGILIRDVETGLRIPHYLMAANTPLPASVKHVFGTVVQNQTRVNVQIVESGTSLDQPYTILGACRITDLPLHLPEGTEIEVTISYDHQARVHVSARELKSGIQAEVDIIRQENMQAQLETVGTEQGDEAIARAATSADANRQTKKRPSASAQNRHGDDQDALASVAEIATTLQTQDTDHGENDDESLDLEAISPHSALLELSDLMGGTGTQADSSQPVLLCNDCGEPLDRSGKCHRCPPARASVKKTSNPAAEGDTVLGAKKRARRRPGTSVQENRPSPAVQEGRPSPSRSKPAQSTSKPGKVVPQPRPRKARPVDPAEAEFWDLVDEG